MKGKANWKHLAGDMKRQQKELTGLFKAGETLDSSRKHLMDVRQGSKYPVDANDLQAVLQIGESTADIRTRLQSPPFSVGPDYIRF